ncbi:hypothetical protein OE09_1018 [Flavobacteriaceae bacterium MAR_2010_72]|nr:hypothetical protein OE09_1018 [Flavobacteriaceae bacterium MAR_2010_72]
MISLAIGAAQVILIILVPVAIFFLGYSSGKKAGYIKRVKESEKQNSN